MAAWTRPSTKDYVLTLLLMKYDSDKYAGSDDFADITVLPGGSFADMMALNRTKEIGDGINKVNRPARQPGEAGRKCLSGHRPEQRPSARSHRHPSAHHHRDVIGPPHGFPSQSGQPPRPPELRALRAGPPRSSSLPHEADQLAWES